MIKIVLAFPPSANRLWRTTSTGKMHNSPEYVAWRKTAVQNAVLQAGRRKISGPYKLTLEVVRPDKRRRDIDNLIKSVSDCLVQAGIIDDSQCEWIEARWVLSEHPCTITIEEIEHENQKLS